ncbi:MAG: hypothetical protein K9J42_07920 [Sulfuritalea sp.]|nr:hypothetical protein [Sulfuritalea sp.]
MAIRLGAAVRCNACTDCIGAVAPPAATEHLISVKDDVVILLGTPRDIR